MALGFRTRGGPGPRAVYRLVWQHGDTITRVFLMGLVSGVTAVVAASFGVLYLVLRESLTIDESLAYAVAVTSAVFFRSCWDEPLFNIPVTEEYLHRGWWRPASVAYFTERIRYLREWGRNGRFPGSARWAIVAWAVYGMMVIAGIPFVAQFPPDSRATGFFLYFAIVVIVSLVFFFMAGLRNRKLHLLALSRGYDLVSFYPAGRRPRQPPKA